MVVGERHSIIGSLVGEGDRAAQELRQLRERGWRPKVGSRGRNHDPDAGQKLTKDQEYYQQVWEDSTWRGVPCLIVSLG
jgi:hypothetical protein